jgi:hypothetical protein
MVGLEPLAFPLIGFAMTYIALEVHGILLFA